MQGASFFWYRMDQPQLLFVSPCSRGAPHFNADLSAAVRWFCGGKTEVVTAAPFGSPPNWQLPWHRSPLTGTLPGFHCNHAIAAALDRKVPFDAAVIVTDHGTLLRRGLDEWVHKKLTEKRNIGLIGVRDRNNYVESRVQVQSFFSNRGVNQADFEDMPTAVASEFLAIPRRVLVKMHERRLLVPEAAHEWPCGYGAYMSFLTQILGEPVMLWGTMDRPEPPLFVSHTGMWRLLPAPWLLNSRFMFFSSLACLQGWSEEEAREIGKKLRDEPSASMFNSIEIIDPLDEDEGVG